MAQQESRLLISIDARNAERTARQLADELNNITRSGSTAERQTTALGSSFKSLAAYMAGIVSVGTAINKMDTYTNLQNRLKLVTSSQAELNTALNDTFKIAQNTAQSWEVVVQVYQRFADNAKKLNLTMADTASLTDTVSKAIAVSGASATSAEAALTQFGQALASGVLRGEEFNSIAEQAPSLLKAIANGLDVDIGKLRAMASEGKLTGEVVVGALNKSKESVDELFGKTDFSIGNSFVQLNNAVVQFVGEAGKANGSASILSSMIKSLSENLGLVANVAVIGGVGLLTKAIVTQVVAVKSAITASIARRASILAEIQAQVQITAIELQRQRQITALALTEVNLARAEMNNALTKTQRAAATMRLTQAEIALTIADKQQTAAVIANTAAQNANTAARSRGAMVLGALGGVTGVLTIGVMALASGYMYLKGRSAEATKKLEEQTQVASQTKEELLKLKGVQADVAKNDLKEAFEGQNKKLKELTGQFSSYVIQIQNANRGNIEVTEISNQVRQGLISQSEALERLNKLDVLTETQRKQGLDLVNRTIQQTEETLKVKNALGLFKESAILAGNASQTASVQQNMQATAMNALENATNGASSALDAFLEKAKAGAKEAQWIADYAKRTGLTTSEAKLFYDAKMANGGKPITPDQANEWHSIYLQSQAVKELDEARQQASRNAVNSAKSTMSAENKLAKQQKDNAKRQAEEAKRIAEEQARSRAQIRYNYLSELSRMNEDYNREVADIASSKFGEEQQKYLTMASEQYKLREELYLRSLTVEINQFNWSERQKLKYQYETNRLIATESKELTNDLKELKIKALDEEYALEKAKIELSMQERLFQANEQFMAETDIINERYRIEKANILLINDEYERATKLRLLELKKQEDATKRLQDAQLEWARIQDQVNGISGEVALSDKRFDEGDASQALFDAQMASVENNPLFDESARMIEREQLWQAHNNRLLEINKRYIESQQLLQLSQAESTTGTLATMMKDMGAEQSAGYKVMFAASKAFAIAQAVMNIQTAMSSAAASLPFPANLGAIMTVASETASIVSAIKSVSDAGFKSGGYTGNAGTSTVAGVVHGQEYVLNAQATKRIGVDTLNAVNSGASIASGGGVSVQIQNYGTSKEFEVEQLTENTVRIIARDEVTRSLNNPSSAISKSIAQNINADRRRG